MSIADFLSQVASIGAKQKLPLGSVKLTKSLGQLAKLEPEFMKKWSLHCAPCPLSAGDEAFRFRMKAGQAETLPILLASGNTVLGVK